MRAIAGPTIIGTSGDYGNALLTTQRVVSTVRHDLSVPGREPRSAVVSRLATGDDAVFTAVVTHLGLARRERRRQVERLCEICARDRVREPLVVLGDFNEWNPLGLALGRLRAELGPARGVRTFPAWRPVLALDRVFVRPSVAGRGVRAVSTELTRKASDHLPVVAGLDLRAK
jgi:endonuclease/exonuclease/phosphatase family metal-dependent hydrolase